MQFTVEEESMKKICFLNVLVIRKGKNIKTNWYNKPTSTGELLNFHSHHPLNYKINVINNLVDKGITLTHKTFHTENITKIKTILIKNNYPVDFINHVIKNRLRHLSRKAALLKHSHTPTPWGLHTHAHRFHTAGFGRSNPQICTFPLRTRIIWKIVGYFKTL